MTSNATSPEAYIADLPAERQPVMEQLRSTILKRLPGGFQETMSYGMIGYVVPHSLYEKGYHCNPELPLPFINIASQKNYVALYHMGIYADKKVLEWFRREYAKYVSTKLDMGKSCIRFRNMESIPYDLIGELCSKMTVEDWIGIYESARKSK